MVAKYTSGFGGSSSSLLMTMFGTKTGLQAAAPHAAANTHPPVFTSLYTASTWQHVSTTTPIYLAHATDADGNTVSYSLALNVGDDSQFNIDPHTGIVTFKVSPDHAHPTDRHHDNVYNIQVVASDGLASHNVTRNVAITVTTANPPNLPGSDDNSISFASGGSATTPENVSTATPVYTAHATAAGGAPIMYSLAPNVGDNNDFNINATTGAVTFKVSPDYEHPIDAGGDNTYNIVVTASNGVASQTTTQAVAISVTDVNDNAPVFTSGTTASEAENTPATNVVYTAHATDADGTSPNNTVSYSLSGADASQFNINATTGAVTFKTSPDYEHPTAAGGGDTYHVTVVATDGGTPALSTSQNVAISVTDVNDNAPVFTSGTTATAPEGTSTSTAVYTANATDADGTSPNNAVTYSLSGQDAADFKINPTTGAVTFVNSPNFETPADADHNNVYNVVVTATDGGTPAMATNQAVSITVTDVAPSAPVDGDTATSNSVPEGAAAGTYTGLTASSGDVNGGTVTCSLTDSANGAFAIDPSTGRVTVVDPTKLDFESTAPNHAYSVTVQASDGTLTSAQTFSIAVTDVPPSTPVDGDAATANSVAQGAAAGTYTGLTASSSDVNGPAVTYSLTDSANGAFTINTSTGAVSVADPTKISYAASGPSHAYNVTVQASDGTLTSSQTFSIAVTPGPATHFVLILSGGGTAGTAGMVTVTAYDAYGNVATGYSGTVQFTSSDGQAVLPANATLTNGTGTFSETLKTSGNESITATDTVTPSITGTASEFVFPSDATHFSISIPTSSTAGMAGTVVVTALDAYGNVASGYTGTAHFTSSDGQAMLPGNYTFTGGDGGVHTFTNGETLETAGNQTVTATDTTTSSITGTSNADAVAPGVATHFKVSIPANGTSGTAGMVTVTALDAYGNTATGYSGTVHFTSSDGSAMLPANMTLSNGTGTFSETLETTGSQTITSTDTVTSTITGTSNTETVAPGAATHFVVSLSGGGTAGTAGMVTVTAYDAYGNVATGYSGTVQFTSSDGQAVLPANSTLTNGTGTFSETLKTSGNESITATDTVTSSITGTASELVAPSTATHFSISIPTSSTAGMAGTVVVTALDAYGNKATGYTGTAQFTSTDSQAVLPANYMFTVSDAGVHTFTNGETLKTAGNQTVTATDTATSSIAGMSNTDVVAPDAATHFSVSIPANGTAGTAGMVTVTALDAYGNTATGYSGTVHFTSSDASAMLPQDMTLSNGVGTFSETLETNGSQTITATDTVTSTIKGTSNAETVAPGPATHFVVSLSGGGTAGAAGMVTVTAYDAQGNVATGYSGTVQFTSSDGQAVLPANATLTNGTGTFSETLKTSGNESITATDTVTPSITGTASEFVFPSDATHFSISIPTSSTAGMAGTVVVTALDAYGNVASGYTGTAQFTSTDGQAMLPGNYTFTGGDGGVHTFANGETLETSGNQTITATDTSTASITGTSNADAVAPGVATHFKVSIPANGTSGTAGSVTVTALDAYGNTATSYSGTVHFTSSDGSAMLPQDMTLTNGVGTFSETLETTGSQTVTATDTVTTTIKGTSNTETVTPGPATHFVLSLSGGGTAGTAGLVTVTAYDAQGNVATNYSGTVQFTSSDGQAVLPANMTLTNGTGTFSETLKTAGTESITATDTVTSSIAGTASELVAPSTATHLSIGIPTSSTAGMAGTVIVTALDAYGNVASGYTGTAQFTSTDGQAMLPGNYTFTGGDGGVHTFTNGETLETAGNQTVTATDTSTASITGTSNADAVAPGVATHFKVSIPANGTSGTTGMVTVTALDAYGNTATSYSGTVHFTSTDSIAMLPQDMTLTDGVGTFSETLETTGSQTITATDTVTTTITGTSNAETVAPGAATHFVVSLSGGGTAGTAGMVTVTAYDAQGNVATGYSGTVQFSSSDGQAVLPANATLTNGIGTFSETLKTAGTESITATDTVTPSITGTASELVAPSTATHFSVGIPTSSTAGMAGTVVVTALDAYGNVASGYTGTAHFTSTDGQAVLPGNYTFTGSDAGVHTFPNGETLETKGNQTITATDTTTSSITGTSGIDVVAPGVTTHFAVSIPANGTSGTAGTVTVTAEDAYGNVTPGYSGTVHFTSSDGSATLPADMMLTNGTGTFSETLRATGSETITATDTVTSTITGTSNTEVVAPADAPPVVTAGHTLNYTEGQGAKPLDPALTVTDSDSPNLAHATVQITGNYVPGEDVLGFTNQNGISGSFSASTGTLTLMGSASPAAYQTALDSVTYTDTSQNPSTAQRTVTVIANDGTLDSSSATDTINVLSVDNPPVVTVGTVTNFSEPPNGTPASSSTPVTIAPNLTISDVDSSNLTSATFVLNNLEPSDALSVSGHAGSSGTIGAISFAITSTAATETVTFTGTDTLAHYAAALDLVQFNNTSENPDTTNRSYTITATDDGSTANGGNPTGTATATQTVTAVDDAPVTTVPASNSVGTAVSNTDFAISGVSIADVDAGSGNVTTTVTVGHGKATFNLTGLASSTGNGTGSVTLTGTVAQVNTALATLTYHSNDGFTGGDTVQVLTNDNGHTGTGGPLSSNGGVANTFQIGVVPQVFYIDNSASGSSNVGTQTNPFKTIADFNASSAPGPGDYVVLEHGSGTYTNGIQLTNGVNLVGGSETLQFTNPVTGAIFTANTASGSNPIIKVSGLANGVAFGGGSIGHIIKGVDVDTTAGTGAAITDGNSNVGTLNMSDIHVATTSGAGILLRGGETVNITGTTNTLSSTTGTALDIENTNIGASGLTFHDISANGGVNGIVLNNTGSSGGLTVTGDGATPGSGGTIQNTVQGALFTSTSNVSLSYMNFTNPDSGNGTVHNADDPTFNSAAQAGINMSNVSTVTFDHLNINGNGGSGGAQVGINGQNVSNLTISNTTVVGFGDDDGTNNDEGDVRLFNLSGTSAITNSTFGFVPGDPSGGDNLVDIRNNAGTLTLNVTGSTFHNTRDSTSGSDGLAVTSTSTASTSATINLNVSHSTFSNLKTGGIDTFARGTSTMNVNITDGGTPSNPNPGNGNTFDPGGTSVTGRAIGLNAQDTAHLNFNINRNVEIKGNGGPVVEIASIGTSVVNGRIDNNTDIQNNGTVNFAGSPIYLNIEDSSTATIDVSGNNISHIGQDAGIDAVVQGNGTNLHNASLDVTIAKNTINMTGSQDYNDGILLQAGGNSNDTTKIYANVHDNSVTLGSSTSPVAFVFENTSSGLASNIYLQNYATSIQATWQNNHNTPGASELDTGNPSGGVPAGHNGGNVNTPSNPNAQLLATGGVAAASPTPGETHLTQAELDLAVAAAIADWAAAGATPAQLAELRAATYAVADLPANTVGETAGDHVTISPDAAGHGWYVDPTPTDNSEFAHAAAANDLFTDPSNAAAGHVDLVTVVEHEMGHILGLPDITNPANGHDLLSQDLVDGERRLPDAADVAQALLTTAASAATGPAAVLGAKLIGLIETVAHGLTENDSFDLTPAVVAKIVTALDTGVDHGVGATPATVETGLATLEHLLGDAVGPALDHIVADLPHWAGVADHAPAVAAFVQTFDQVLAAAPHHLDGTVH